MSRNIFTTRRTWVDRYEAVLGCSLAIIIGASLAVGLYIYVS
jgi:hypothetical protein